MMVDQMPCPPHSQPEITSLEMPWPWRHLNCTYRVTLPNRKHNAASMFMTFPKIFIPVIFDSFSTSSTKAEGKHPTKIVFVTFYGIDQKVERRKTFGSELA